MTSIAIIIPAHNAGSTLDSVLRSIQQQSVKAREIIVLDIESTDSTNNIAEEHSAKVIPIFAKDWDPWHTRQWAASQTKKSDVVVYLSQDCTLGSSDSLEHLVDTLISKNSDMVYGRQRLDHGNAPKSLRHLYNSFFPAQNLRPDEIEKSLPAAIKLCIYYHAFAAYPRQKLLGLSHNLPNKVIAADDIIVMNHLLRHRKAVDYCAKSFVVRSPAPSIKQYFQQSMDRGIAYSREKSYLSFTDKDLGAIKKFYYREKKLSLNKKHIMERLVGIIYGVSCTIGYFMGKHNYDSWGYLDHTNRGKNLLRGLM